MKKPNRLTKRSKRITLRLTPYELEQLNKARGYLMVTNGEAVSVNSFIIDAVVAKIKGTASE